MIQTDNKRSSDNLTPLHQAALDLAAKGIPVFPLAPGGKNPLIAGGFKTATTDTDKINAWWSDCDANIGMPTAGYLVQDVDCKNGKDGYAALRELEAQHGPLTLTLTQKTPSGGKHYIYSATGIPCKVNCPGPGLDIRGDGGYIVVAPSVIDGVAYEMSDDPIAAAPQWLIDRVLNHQVNLKTVKSGIVEEGARNTFIFSVAMECNRNGLSREDALAKVQEANGSCNPPLDDAELTKAVNSAYRYDANLPPEIAELNNTYAVISVGGKCRVMKEIIDPDTKLPDIELISPNDFQMFFCNRLKKVDSGYIQLGKFWLNHLHRREYVGITFDPYQTPKGYYNLWHGFAVKPKQGDCSLFLAHIRDNIANGDEAIYNYILALMAHSVQKPHELLGIALVLRGAMGTGKGVFANGFGSLFGRHYLPLAQGSQLTGKFNSHMKDKVLIFADESFWAGDKAAEGVLKSLITEPFLIIEGKGENAYKIKNHLRFVFATNNSWCVPAGAQERRFFVLDVGEKHMQNHKYFNAIQRELDKGGREALLYHLQNLDISGVNLRKFPQTAALFEQKLFSMTPIEKFLYVKLEAGSLGIDWPTEIAVRDLYQDFIVFCTQTGVRHRPSSSEFGTQLKKLVPSITRAKGSASKYNTHRPNVYRLPSLSACRRAFERYINYQVEWPVYEATTAVNE